MSRPIKLVKQEKLAQLHDLYNLGVTIIKLSNDQDLQGKISYPHLHTLLKYYEAWVHNPQGKDYAVVEQSLFPAWLAKCDADVGIQDTKKYRYEGKMPLGRWVEIVSTH